ncbi:MAG: hypothetical protein OEX04_16585 [Acidimicrobiia bacterium]|nr:hypothetical protein [Acidimicrobiia bacterium]MDH4309086.1 hypothetical protein [Acidimicrobiia bacterium]MDH5294589.1 hypothetical protein [Acidimicrobiia bacterium]
MAVFFGEMQTKSDTSRMKAVVTVENGRVRLASGTAELGEWPLHTVRFEEYTDKSFLMAVEDEELILFLDELDRFRSEVGRYIKKSGDERRRPTHPAFRKKDEEPTQTLGEEIKEDVSREVASITEEARDLIDKIPRGTPLLVGAGVFLLLLIFLPQVIAIITLVGGTVALLAGGFAYADSGFALRLPWDLTPTKLVAAGALLLAVGIVVFTIR